MPEVITVVVDTANRQTPFSEDRFVGHLVRRGVDAEPAVKYGRQVSELLRATQPRTITTHVLRHIATDLLEPGASIAGVLLHFGKPELKLVADPQAPLLDHRVRAAMNHAIDRRAIMAGLGREVPDAWIDAFPYDPDFSFRLLEVAGHTGGFEARVLSPTSELAGSAPFAMMTKDLARVGVRLSVDVQPWSKWIERVRSPADGRTMYYAGGGLFLSSLSLQSSRVEMSELYVRNMVRDLNDLAAASGPAPLTRLIFAASPISMVPAACVPPRRDPLDRRRMQVWMWEDGLESLVCLVGWWPAFTTASRIDYAESIDEVISDTLDDAVADGACFEQLEIMSHGNTGFIKMGDTGDYIQLSDFDAAGNPMGKTKDLLDALKRAMCPGGYLSFTACNQGNGDLLRKISAYIDNAVTVSGFSGTGYPDLVPGGDVIGEDLHFQNGSTASGPP